MAVAKEQIRQIISENNISSVADVYTLLKDSFKDISDPIPEVGCGQSPQKAIIMMPYLSCKKIENDVYNFPT